MKRLAGFTLPEVVIGMAIVAVTLFAILKAYTGSYSAVSENWNDTLASLQAQGELDLVLSQRWDESGPAGAAVPSTTLGRDSGETVVSDFDDIDDFNGYSRTYPKFSVQVQVHYVASVLNGTQFSYVFSATPTGSKRVVATVLAPSGAVMKEISTVVVNNV